MKQVPLEKQQLNREANLDQALRQSGQRLKNGFDDALFRRCQEAIRNETPCWLAKPQSLPPAPSVTKRTQFRRLFPALVAISATLILGLFLFRSNKSPDDLSGTVVVNRSKVAEIDKADPFDGASEVAQQAVESAISPWVNWVDESPTAQMYQSVESRLLEAEANHFQPSELLLSAAKLTSQISDYDFWQQKTGDYLSRLTSHITVVNPTSKPDDPLSD